MKVAVIGTGHVGLVTCATFAHIGHDVVGMDHDAEKISKLGDGVCPFFEPRLQELVTEETASGRLRFTPDASHAIPGAEIVMICVGTPAKANGEANLAAVEKAARDVAPHLARGVTIVEKSTVPAGTADRLRRVLERERPDLAGGTEVVSNPEFLREGQAVKDSLDPDRILIGAQSPAGFEAMRRLYEPLTRAGHPLIETDIATAELAKHASNAFLALKISFVNALARLCERAGADVTAVADVMGSDPRIGRAFLDAGLGYGGFCFPKDLQAFERLSASLGYDFRLLREIARVNEEAIDAVEEKIKDALWNLEDKRISLLGLSFKPGTDDVRFSPSLALARKLLAEGAHVIGYDPEADHNAKSEVPEMEIASDVYDALDGSHCLVLCTEWDEFRALDLPRVRSLMTYPIVVDGRNVFDPQRMQTLGFSYYGTGRPSERRT